MNFIKYDYEFNKGNEMRFIPAKFAPLFMGMIVMPIMIMGLPFIVLVQKMPFDSPQFWSVWGDTVLEVAPFAVPMALATIALARLVVGLFIIKPTLTN